MDLSSFTLAATRLDQEARAKGFSIEVGHWLNSTVLRLSKPRWANGPLTQPQKESAIFFSVWRGENGGKLNYNIHALKLRKLKGYKLESKKFAEAFRKAFASYAPEWPNVRVDFGPLNLMEGWMEPENITDDAVILAEKFMKIDHLIDELLNKYSL